MKKMRWLVVSFTSMMSLFLCSLPCHGEEFGMREDGSVRMGDQVFQSMEAYVASEYFRVNGMRCGTQPPVGGAELPLARSPGHCSLSSTSIQDEYFSGGVLEVRVWWHVIQSTYGQGIISDATIAAQMEALNEDYRAMSGTVGAKGYDVRIQFALAGIDRVTNNGWFTDSDADMGAYKTALAKDPNLYVNIYTNDARGYLGYAYFPQDSAGAWWDGIVMNWQAVGGRNNGFFEYDQGRTLVHEMGHYLGLYHTFEGGCTNGYTSGDLILDTNAEAAPNYTACTFASSCGSPDPINNYMDYSYDSCMWEFTREQANRAVCSLVNYRPQLYSVKSAVPPLISPLILK